VAICSTGYALSGTLSRRMPGWEVISWAVVVSLPVVLPLTFYLWPDNLASVPLPSWVGLLYVALISQYLGFWLWNTALAVGGVARMGQLQLLQPFATLGLAALILGETIDLRMISFATAVMVVVALGLKARVGAVTKQHAPAPATAKLTVDEIAAKVDKLGLTRRNEAAMLIRSDRDR
jgi:drug/metabolite transporter (DMT)-like permease